MTVDGMGATTNNAVAGDAIAGCLFGMAIGDALAAPTEFIRSAAEIRERFGPDGPAKPSGRVTDDTQMALAVGDALMAAGPPWSAETLEPALRAAFVAWMDSPENTRAPGFTCMSACRHLKEGRFWWDASVLNSKGCGANMRVQPVGLLDADAATRAGVAQFQAALTHGHPTALAASDLTAFAIAELAAGAEPARLSTRLREYARSQEGVYHEAWLGPLWQQPGVESPGAFIGRGWSECVAVLDAVDHVFASATRTRTAREDDPCAFTGEGWIAEEAFATALLCFLLYPDDPVAALRRAAVTSGDSDSLACIAGSLAGARHGLATWPADWVRDIEYADRLARLGKWLVTGGW
jgi:ADP-ribosylglycohydrolase